MNNTIIPQSLPHGYKFKGKKHEYTIDHALGQGAFGITYLARFKEIIHGEIGTGTAKVDVCIKEFFMRDLNSRDEQTGILHDSTSDSLVSRYRRAFEREADNLARLQHPNIVNIFEVIRTNNTAYIVMEYKDGGSLDSYIDREGRLSETEGLRLFHPLCDAMYYMHAQNMLHLDLKPKNVMLDENGHVFLIDFGLSKQYTQDGEPESSTTIGLGTPGYAPLEQGKRLNKDKFHSELDVYSLGGTLYKMLMGTAPPDATEVSEAILDGTDLIRQNLLANGISSKTASVVSKAMHPSSRKRYQSVAELMNALDWTVQSYEKIEKEDVIPSPSSEKRTVMATEETIIHIDHVEPQFTHNGHEYIDLGLPSGTLWAACNIGADTFEEFGDYYAWGEISTKEDYSRDTLKFQEKRNVLNLSIDAASQNWGGSWRMPTDEEWTELREKCTWKWTVKGHQKGYKVTSKSNSNSIFLPAAGCRVGETHLYIQEGGYYWSSSLDVKHPYDALCIYFNDRLYGRYRGNRFLGRSVRPVFRQGTKLKRK